MTDTSQGPGWWLASDGKWYAPELHPNASASVYSGIADAPVAERDSPVNGFCPACGTERVSGASFCASCGSALTGQSGDAALPVHQQNVPPMSTSGLPPFDAPPEAGMPPHREPFQGPSPLPPIPGSSPYAPDPGHTPSPGGNEPLPPTNSTATLALVFSILFWPVGIILGHIARAKIRRTGERGAGVALAALIIGYLWGAVVIIVIVVALAGSSTSGFNNLTTLESSVTQQVNANLNNPSNAAYSPGTSVTSVICVHNSGTQYSCAVKASDGSSTSISITVSSDGSRWVSNG